MADTLRIRQVRSANGSSRKQRDSLRTLGLGRIGKSTERTDDPIVRGLIDSMSLLAAKAYGKLALDSVYIDIKDLDGLRREVDDAVAVGFDIKVALHPTQVIVIRDGYAPTSEQVTWARHVLAAAAEQRGAFAFEGIMVDAPVLRRAG